MKKTRLAYCIVQYLAKNVALNVIDGWPLGHMHWFFNHSTPSQTAVLGTVCGIDYRVRYQQAHYQHNLTEIKIKKKPLDFLWQLDFSNLNLPRFSGKKVLRLTTSGCRWTPCKGIRGIYGGWQKKRWINSYCMKEKQEY